MKCNHHARTDFGPEPFTANIEQRVMRNTDFRTALWTGCHLQMTLMCIPPCKDIGLEMHPDTDQFLRIEQGKAVVVMGVCKEHPELEQEVCAGDGIFVPAGTWHNIINTGRVPLKLSSIYAPPNHRRGTVHHTKEDAQKEEYSM